MAAMATSDRIVISGAREHNLKDVSLALPRDALTVITGLSGSGKSSLAFDTIYAEGQRRYVESLSAYARQFLGQMDKPDVDSIEGLSPAISIDQKTTSRNPRSTVGTVTEIYDYLRLLWARIGHPHCHICGRPISGQSAEQIIDQVMELPEGVRWMREAFSPRGPLSCTCAFRRTGPGAWRRQSVFRLEGLTGCFSCFRYPVEGLLELLSSGMTTDEVLADYEDLERDDLLAALAFAALLVRTRRLQPVGP